MNLEEILSDKEKVILFGLQATKSDWKQHGEEVIASVARNSEWSYWAGRNWPDAHYDTRFADAVAQDPQMSSYAGVDWPDSRFDKRFTEKVAQSPELSFQAGYRWSDARFDTRFADVVAQSPGWSYHAGINWSDDRFDGRFADAVAQDPEWSYKAGDRWSNARFDHYKDKLIEAVAQDPKWSHWAGLYWSNSRFDARFVETVATYPTWSSKAVIHWPIDRVRQYVTTLLPAMIDGLQTYLGQLTEEHWELFKHPDLDPLFRVIYELRSFRPNDCIINAKGIPEEHRKLLKEAFMIEDPGEDIDAMDDASIIACAYKYATKFKDLHQFWTNASEPDGVRPSLKNDATTYKRLEQAYQLVDFEKYPHAYSNLELWEYEDGEEKLLSPEVVLLLAEACEAKQAYQEGCFWYEKVWDTVSPKHDEFFDHLKAGTALEFAQQQRTLWTKVKQQVEAVENPDYWKELAKHGDFEAWASISPGHANAIMDLYEETIYEKNAGRAEPNPYIMGLFHAAFKKHMDRIKKYEGELHDGAIRERYKKRWWEFVFNTRPHVMADVPVHDFYKVADAYELLKTNGLKEANERKFFKTFMSVAHEGDVGVWAEAIIDTIKEDTTGGSNYRKLFREVAVK